jgi:pimeloyl-ACP methyl ester carboxylesterase
MSVAVAESLEIIGLGGGRLVGERRAADQSRGVVVLLHGGGQTRHSWGTTAASLAAGGWTAVTVDLRGHGDSDWDPQGRYDLDHFVADLHRIAETVGEPPVFVGASLGGMTSLVAAGESPGLARALVLVDIVIDVEESGIERIHEFLTAHRGGFADLESVAEAIEAYNPVRKRKRNLDGLRKNVRLHDDGRWYWHWDPAVVEIDDEPRRRADPERLRAAARALHAPVLLVRGRHSDVVSEAGLAAMLELLPDARVARAGGAGHMVAGDDNDVFMEALNAFLEDLDTGSEAG